MRRTIFTLTTVVLTILGMVSLPAQVVHTFAALDVQNIFTGTPNTFQGVIATSVTDSGLTSGDCVQASTGGLLATTVNPCISGPQYAKLRCESGLGDGLNAMTAGTYLQSFCYNDSGVTWTITGIKCYVDGGSSSTLNASGNTLGALLTGPVTCGTASFAIASQSANVALTSSDYIKFTFVADGSAKQTTWIVSMTQ